MRKQKHGLIGPADARVLYQVYPLGRSTQSIRSQRIGLGHPETEVDGVTILLGRDLKPDEVREVTRMARRIAAILLLQPQLHANYRAVKGSTREWPADRA